MKQSYFDIFDSNDNPLQVTAGYDEVHSTGLWHHGVHVIIYTPEKEILMQKRSSTLKYHPGEIEISVGGGVDAGETPEHAVIREIKEELSLDIPISSLRFLGKTKYNHRTKTQINRLFIFSYAVCLPKEKLMFKTDPEETSLAFFISQKKLRRALRVHRIKNVGIISPLYAYWRFLLDSIV